MAIFYDITNWEEHEYYNTGGTRNKAIVENPQNGDLYFFKTSLKKTAIDYTYEFWSEIIASAIGKLLGFDVLNYDVALNNGQLGCLSKSMIDAEHQQLDEGYKWLLRNNMDYNIDNHEAYTFQIIDSTLQHQFPNRAFINNIISTIVFDSIIGNEDRHQENWGIIVSFSKRRTRGLSSYTFQFVEYNYAPIYDNGSSLGRELTEQKVKNILNDQIQLDSYINRGRSEIHWNGKSGKLRHFELIKEIADSGYKHIIINEIERIRQNYDSKDIESIINSIDNCLPPNYLTNKIPQYRKDFLIKLVNLRIERLLSLPL